MSDITIKEIEEITDRFNKSMKELGVIFNRLNKIVREKRILYYMEAENEEEKPS